MGGSLVAVMNMYVRTKPAVHVQANLSCVTCERPGACMKTPPGTLMSAASKVQGTRRLDDSPSTCSASTSPSSSSSSHPSWARPLTGKTHWTFGCHMKGGGVDFVVDAQGAKLHSLIIVAEDSSAVFVFQHSRRRVSPPFLNAREVAKDRAVRLAHNDRLVIGTTEFLVTRVPSTTGTSTTTGAGGMTGAHHPSMMMLACQPQPTGGPGPAPGVPTIAPYAYRQVPLFPPSSLPHAAALNAALSARTHASPVGAAAAAAGSVGTGVTAYGAHGTPNSLPLHGSVIGQQHATTGRFPAGTGHSDGHSAVLHSTVVYPHSGGAPQHPVGSSGSSGVSITPGVVDPRGGYAQAPSSGGSGLTAFAAAAAAAASTAPTGGGHAALSNVPLITAHMLPHSHSHAPSPHHRYAHTPVIHAPSLHSDAHARHSSAPPYAKQPIAAPAVLLAVSTASGPGGPRATKGVSGHVSRSVLAAASAQLSNSTNTAVAAAKVAAAAAFAKAAASAAATAAAVAASKLEAAAQHTPNPRRTSQRPLAEPHKYNPHLWITLSEPSRSQCQQPSLFLPAHHTRSPPSPPRQLPTPSPRSPHQPHPDQQQQQMPASPSHPLSSNFSSRREIAGAAQEALALLRRAAGDQKVDGDAEEAADALFAMASRPTRSSLDLDAIQNYNLPPNKATGAGGWDNNTERSRVITGKRGRAAGDAAEPLPARPTAAVSGRRVPSVRDSARTRPEASPPAAVLVQMAVVVLTGLLQQRAAPKPGLPFVSPAPPADPAPTSESCTVAQVKSRNHPLYRLASDPSLSAPPTASSSNTNTSSQPKSLNPTTADDPSLPAAPAAAAAVAAVKPKRARRTPLMADTGPRYSPLVMAAMAIAPGVDISILAALERTILSETSSATTDPAAAPRRNSATAGTVPAPLPAGTAAAPTVSPAAVLSVARKPSAGPGSRLPGGRSHLTVPVLGVNGFPLLPQLPAVVSLKGAAAVAARASSAAAAIAAAATAASASADASAIAAAAYATAAAAAVADSTWHTQNSLGLVAPVVPAAICPAPLFRPQGPTCLFCTGTPGSATAAAVGPISCPTATLTVNASAANAPPACPTIPAD
ncbi:MAG: hypothetical protein WDW38_009929 [Sanguina aurantia]